VLLSQSTYELVRELVECDPLPGLKLKGVDAPETGYVVRSLRPRMSSP
jgi:hypothetical protein